MLAAEEVRHAEAAQRVRDAGDVTDLAPLLHGFGENRLGPVVVVVGRVQVAEQRERGGLVAEVVGFAGFFEHDQHVVFGIA